MGSDYTLNVTCKILPEYTDFITKEYLLNHDQDNTLELYPASDIIDLQKTNPTSNTLAALLKEVNDAAASEAEESLYHLRLTKEQAEKILEYIRLPKFYRDLIEIWIKLQLKYFAHYEMKDDNTFTCKIRKRCNWHKGDLREDMEAFVKDILVPITSEITFCTITIDDYDICTHYTDLELRGGGRLNLREIIKSIRHIYDGDEIVETRVIYKRSIKPFQKIDLDRCYERY